MLRTSHRPRPRTRLRSACAGGALVVVALLTACTGSSGGTEPAPGPSYASGPITEAQYVDIVRAVHGCMVDKGYDVDDVAKRPDGVTYGFFFSGSGTASRSTTGQDDLVECEGRYGLMEAELAYQDQAALSGAEREAVFGQMVDCLAAAGVTGVTSSASATDVASAISALADTGADTVPAEACWTQYSSRLFGSLG